MRKHLEKCFKITEEENENFDENKEEEVTELLGERQHLITPQERANPEALRQDNPLFTKITPREVKTTITKFRNHKAPGKSKINKTIMKQLPNKMILRLTNIFNASLSMGYFPNKLKIAPLD